ATGCPIYTWTGTLPGDREAGYSAPLACRWPSHRLPDRNAGGGDCANAGTAIHSCVPAGQRTRADLVITSAFRSTSERRPQPRPSDPTGSGPADPTPTAGPAANRERVRR